MASASKGAQKELRAAWDDMIQSLQQARDAIDQPELMPPPPGDRILAEGYRYLMGYVHAAVERAFHEDPVRPHFRNALSIITRATIDNADAIYFYAPIDGRESYLLRGAVGDARHWRGDAPAPTGRKAPHYVIFETSWGVLAGDSGDLSELRPGMKTQTGRIDSSTIEVDADGRFEILFAPERPEGHTGNFVPTLKVASQPHPTDPTVPAERYASYLSGRQLFYDWEREDAIHLEMAQLGAEGTHPEPYGPEAAAGEIRRFGEIVKNQMRFWNAFWTIPMGTHGERPGSIPGVAFPRNAFNTINAASGATGGGMSTNLYAGGVAELGPDEALIVENRITLQPQYVGLQLGNLWGESIEYADQVGSRNGHQSHLDDDGVIRFVISHEDPGVPNWLDTTGHREVFMAPRWAYSETPAPEQWPTVTATKVPFNEIRKHLPPNTPTVTPTQRRQEIATRQTHVRQRFRHF
ncbi:MAG: DUF1214 domain-containing protein [Deltaproteobacteria bacterium]|nr:DUF1214 domain-containing protein [Deltaproteobacteria bacterium]MBW2418705.1 DUF1214 domain-containing protein [Deltaproteobacteria bacterium]